MSRSIVTLAPLSGAVLAALSPSTSTPTLVQNEQDEVRVGLAMIERSKPQLAGLGDGVVGWTPGVRPIMGAPNSAADNAVSFPSVRPGGGGAIERSGLARKLSEA